MADYGVDNEAILHIMDEIEHKVLAPTASSERLLGIVHSISNGKALPRGLSEKMQDIAKRSDGEVPLHGRLFAQWLHFAFPHQCPYPSLLETADILSKSQWTNRTQFAASVDESADHVLSLDASSLGNEDIEVDKFWTDHEVLPAHDVPEPPLGNATTAVRSIVQISALFLDCVAFSPHGGQPQEQVMKIARRMMTWLWVSAFEQCLWRSSEGSHISKLIVQIMMWTL